MRQIWNRVTVIGCGLIGASFALAVKRAGLCAVIAGWDHSSSALAEALERNVIDGVDKSFVDGEISSADLVYLAMPIEEIIGFLRERGNQIKAGAVVTDAGSTKVSVCRAARRFLAKDRHFVGGHPIAGSHERGHLHASANLFNEASYVLIKDEDAAECVQFIALKETLERLGACVVLMDAEEHDRALALVSHLPQIVSSALAAVIKDNRDRDALIDLSGAGYRDMTRLAASSWSMWRSILTTNPKQIADALDALIETLSGVRDELRGCTEDKSSELKLTGSLFVEAGTDIRPD